MPSNIRSEFQGSASEAEIGLAQDFQAQQRARIDAAPMPLTVPARVLNFLEKEKADYAIARLRFETKILDELEVEADALNVRMFKFAEADQRLRVNLMAEQEIRARGGHSATPDRGVFERDLSDNADRRASAMQKLASLQAKARVLTDRLKASNNLVLGQGYAGRLKFLAPPAFNAKTTLSKLRDRIFELRADLTDLEITPFPAAVARERLVQWLDRNARSINVRPLLARGEQNGSPYVPKVLLPASGGGAVEGESAVGLMCWLFRDELLAKLGEQIDRAARDDEALSEEEWTSKKRAIVAEVLETERLEESLCWSLLQSGKDVELRGNADPRAILAVTDGRP